MESLSPVSGSSSLSSPVSPRMGLPSNPSPPFRKDALRLPEHQKHTYAESQNVRPPKTLPNPYGQTSPYAYGQSYVKMKPTQPAPRHINHQHGHDCCGCTCHYQQENQVQKQPSPRKIRMKSSSTKPRTYSSDKIFYKIKHTFVAMSSHQKKSRNASVISAPYAITEGERRPSHSPPPSEDIAPVEQFTYRIEEYEDPDDMVVDHWAE